MLVGGDDDARSALNLVLSPQGWTLEEVATLEEGLDAARNRRFDLMVTSQKSSGKEDVEFLRQIRKICPNTKVIILTDESTPEDVQTALREHAFGYLSKDLSVTALARTVNSALEATDWTGDIEVISATPQLLTVAVRCKEISAERLLHFLREMSRLPPEELNTVAVAFREMLMNAIEHGGHFDPSKYVEICFVRTRHALVARLKDPGEGFRLDEIRHAAVGNPPDDPIAHVIRRNETGMRPGGFGVMLAKNMVDELIYNEQGNEVLLVKYLPGFEPEKPAALP